MDWITVAAAFLIAILSGMGVGSAGLLVVYLTVVMGAPQLMAQGINLLFFLFASGASMLIHLKRRRIFLLAVAVMVAAGLPAAYLGTRLAMVLDERTIRVLFGAFLVAASIPVLKGAKQSKKVKKT